MDYRYSCFRINNINNKLKGYDAHSSKMGKIKTIVLDMSIAICYFNFVVHVPDLILGIFAIMANVFQLLTIVGYGLLYKKQVDKNALSRV